MIKGRTTWLSLFSHTWLAQNVTPATGPQKHFSMTWLLSMSTLSLIHPNDSGDSFPSTNTGPSGSATLGKLPTVQGRLEPHFPWAHWPDSLAWRRWAYLLGQEGGEMGGKHRERLLVCSMSWQSGTKDTLVWWDRIGLFYVPFERVE